MILDSALLMEMSAKLDRLNDDVRELRAEVAKQSQVIEAMNTFADSVRDIRREMSSNYSGIDGLVRAAIAHVKV